MWDLKRNTEHCLITLIEKWKKCVDNGDALGTLLADRLHELLTLRTRIVF